MTKPCQHIIPCVCTALSLLAALPHDGKCDDNPTARLARDLATEGDHGAAAIEYRRLALAEADGVRRAGYYWAAAYQYHRAGKGELAEKMLDRAEDDSDQITSQALLLRAEISLATGRPDKADFYLAGLTRKKTDSPSYRLASRRLAKARLLDGNIQGAKDALAAAGLEPELGAAQSYAKGAGRIPMLGGVLGLVPGLGYAYSGEYANALRSLILNGLFIYAMVDTANDEEWGAFAAISFFELTWYTGSIYGGIDAAHRYNRNRLDTCLQKIDGQSRFEPDLKRIPIISLRFTF